MYTRKRWSIDKLLVSETHSNSARFWCDLTLLNIEPGGHKYAQGTPLACACVVVKATSSPALGGKSIHGCEVPNDDSGRNTDNVNCHILLQATCTCMYLYNFIRKWMYPQERLLKLGQVRDD